MEYRRVVDELHKPARRNYPRRKVDIRGIDETWQADLVEMQGYSRENRGFRYLLTIIDTFSKYSWAVPIKQKTGVDVASAMESVLKNKRIPKNLQVDRGKEFYNKNFQDLMARYKINLYSTCSNLKASICERFNRTLKNNMWKKFSLQGNYNWINILPNLIESYNNTKHRTINMKPKDVNAENEQEVLRRFSFDRRLFKNPKFGVGDKVRVSKSKHVFEKGYTPNWSTEIFTIQHVSKTKPVTYHLLDYKDNPIAGGFYEQELQKVMYPDVYLVEKVLRKRGNQVYVKWLGFDNTHNSWIDKKIL